MAVFKALYFLVPFLAAMSALEVDIPPYKLKTRNLRPILDIYKNKELAISLSMVNIAEKDSAGNDVPTSSPPHKFTLDTRDFHPYNQVKPVNASGSTPAHDMFLIRGTLTELSPNTTLSMEVIVSRGSGTLQGYNTNDKLQAVAGSIFIRFAVNGWVFCRSPDVICPNGLGFPINGEFLDLDLMLSPGTVTDNSRVFSVKKTDPDVTLTLDMKRSTARRSGNSYTELVKSDSVTKVGDSKIRIRFEEFTSSQSAEYRYVSAKLSGASLLKAHPAIALLIMLMALSVNVLNK